MGLIACAALVLGAGAGWFLLRDLDADVAAPLPSAHLSQRYDRSAHFNTERTVGRFTELPGEGLRLISFDHQFLKARSRRSLNLAGAALLAISSSGEIAVSMDSRPSGVHAQVGTLARVPTQRRIPMPRAGKRAVGNRDQPDGENLAIVRDN